MVVLIKTRTINFIFGIDIVVLMGGAGYLVSTLDIRKKTTSINLLRALLGVPLPLLPFLRLLW